MRLCSLRGPDGKPGVAKVEGERVHVRAASSMLAWLRGEGRERSGQAHPTNDVTLLAPVPEPPSVRDFYAFERHVAAGWRRRGADVPEYWYEAPAFYFSNPASILGPGEPVRRPDSVSMLDFELEIAAVVGAAGEIAGF